MGKEFLFFPLIFGILVFSRREIGEERTFTLRKSRLNRKKESKKVGFFCFLF